MPVGTVGTTSKIHLFKMQIVELVLVYSILFFVLRIVELHSTINCWPQGFRNPNISMLPN